MTPTTDTDRSRWLDIFTQRYWAATTTLCLGVALFAFNAFLVSTSLPTAARETGGVKLISWAVTIYLVLSIVGGAAAARLNARFGSRAALMGSALLFLAGTLLAAAATSMAQILAGRALQGLGEGIVAALCYALIPALFPSRLIPKVFGAEAVVWATAAFGGPLIAGVLTETISWRAAFLVNVPMVAIFLLLVAAVVPAESTAGERAAMPILRLVAIGAGIMMLALAGIVTTRPGAFALVLAAAAVLIAIVAADRRSAAPLFPSDAFSPRSKVGLGLWIVLLMPFAQAFSAVYLVLTLQSLWGFTATAAGALNAGFALSWSFVAIGVASISERADRSRLIALGPVLVLAGLSTIVIGLTVDLPALVFAGQVALGAGFGVSWGFVSQTVMDFAREGERDRASALLPTLQSAGYAIGAAVAGLVGNTAGYGEAADGPAVRHAAIAVFSAATVAALAGVVAGYSLRIKLGRAES